MSNKKQTEATMYTHENVVQMLQSLHTLEENLKLSMAKLNPIRIQKVSDEEINKLADEHILYNDAKRNWFIEGMKYMRDKIQIETYGE